MLTISHLTKTYKGGKKAVDNLSLTVEAGDLFGFIGHNGAGKTTTIRALCGALTYDSGTITIGGHDLETEPVLCKRQLAYIPDNPELYDYMTGQQYLSFIADVFSLSAEKRRENTERFARELEIHSALPQLISSYSHGMKQKLALVAALIHEPRLLVMDEPFVGLDPKAAFALKNILSDMCQKGGAIFFSTHVLDVAEKICNKIGIIKDGKLLAAGATQELTRSQSLEALFLTLIEE